MKGPGFRLDLDIRRKWICPKCGDIRRSRGFVTAQSCGCEDGGVWMTLHELPKIHRVSLPRPSTPIKFDDDPLDEVPAIEAPAIADPAKEEQDDFAAEIDVAPESLPIRADVASIEPQADDGTTEPATVAPANQSTVTPATADTKTPQPGSVAQTSDETDKSDKSAESSDAPRRKRRGTRRGRKRRGGGKSGSGTPNSSPPPSS